MSDSEAVLAELLVLRCRRGDVAAWNELVSHWQDRLLYFLRRMLADERDAWDVLQQTWLEVFRSQRRLRDPRALRPWLYRIARNQAITHRRRSRTPPEHLSAGNEFDALDEIAAPHQPNDFLPEDAQRIHRALSKLPLPQREALTLVFLEEMTVEEVAEVLGVPCGTVKSRLHYAKRAMRELLTGAEPL
jgi:RNA polymerase sigma-70 factor (ECF subfamily)